MVSNQENKVTLFSSTLKVDKNKVSLFSWFEVQWLRYSHFVLLIVCPMVRFGSEQQNCYISCIWPQIKKIRALYFLHLSKLKIIKCLYFLNLRSNEWDIVILLFLKGYQMGRSTSIWQSGYISGIWPDIQKIRTLYFLHLGKLKKIKCNYFLDLRSNDWDMVILLFSKWSQWGNSGQNSRDDAALSIIDQNFKMKLICD